MQQTPSEFLKLLSLGPLPQSRLDFLTEDLALHRLPLLRMRRPTLHAVPRTTAAVHQRLLGTRPRPDLDHAVQHQVHRKRPDAGVHVTHLLLARSPHLLDIMEQLLDGTQSAIAAKMASTVTDGSVQK